MAKKTDNKTALVVFAFVILGVFAWWMVKMINSPVSTGSKAAVRNDYINRNTQTSTNGGCNSECNPATDNSCPSGLTCVDTALEGNSPDYRCRLEGSTSSEECRWVMPRSTPPPMPAKWCGPYPYPPCPPD